MPRWIPGANGPIGPNEPVARHLFDEPQLAGAGDQPPLIPLLDIRNFQETRGAEYSLDRLGRTGIERNVRVYLLERAIHAGTRFHPQRSFDGWAVVRARHLQPSQYIASLVASPVRGDGLDENPYHAHV